MRVLVDTHCWLWQLGEPHRLGQQARTVLSSPENEVFFSAASAWEIVIKHTLGRLSLPSPPAEYIPSRMAALGNLSLPVAQTHVLRVAALPLHHKDPFDRVLIAQALVEGLTLITVDPVMRMYEAPIIWAAQ